MDRLCLQWLKRSEISTTARRQWLSRASRSNAIKPRDESEDRSQVVQRARWPPGACVLCRELNDDNKIESLPCRALCFIGHFLPVRWAP